MKWINVKDRLPEKYDDYITYDEYGITAITHYNMQGFFSKNGTIIHWMPLPEPPEDHAAKPPVKNKLF